MKHRAEIAIDRPVPDAFLVWLDRQVQEAGRSSCIDDVCSAAAQAQANRVMTELWARVFCDGAVA